jgi:hypothetical protein
LAAARSVLYLEEHDGKLIEAERAETRGYRPREFASNNAGGLLGFPSVPSCSGV